MVTCQSSELGWEVTVEFPVNFLSLGRGFFMGPMWTHDMMPLEENQIVGGFSG